jgi:anti-sigma B factor antagonist
MPDEIPAHVENGVVVVCPVGEVDLDAAPSLRAALRRAVQTAAQAVRVDLTAVTFVDSTALAAMVDAWNEAGARGITFCLERAAPNVQRVLDITGLDRLLCRA